MKPERRPPVVTSDMQIGPDVDLDREDIRLGDGTRLTNELAEEINEDVRRAAGRPSLSGGRKHSPQVSAGITLELQAELRDYSKRSGLSPSQVLRRALEELMGGRPPADMPGKQPAPTKRPRRTTRKDPASRLCSRAKAGTRPRHLAKSPSPRANHPFISTGTSLTDGITGTGAADPLTWLRLARCPC